jgi:uncharacterized membrane protein (UPF0127 family)
VLNIKIRKLENIDKLLGVIKYKDAGVFFNTRLGIHTFFVKTNLDLVILDKKKVVCLKKNLKPNRIFLWNPKFSKVLELPAGSIDNLNLKLGNILKFTLK